MAKGMTLKALLTLDAKQFQQGIGKVQQQIGSIANAFKSAFAVGSVAMFGKSLVEFTKNYEDAMARVKAVSNASAGEMKMMNDEALRLGATTRYTATQVAETLEVLTRNGFNAQKATKSLAATLQLAQANAVSLADAGNMITNTLNMFGLGVDQVQRVNDVMSSIASNTATNLQDFYDALVNASPMAHALGISIEETAAALGALAQRGIKGADAGTQLRMSLQKMVDPSSMKKLKALGVEIDEEIIKAEGLSGVLKKLNEANLSVSQLNEIFTVRSSKSILQLVRAVDDFNAILEITKNSSGTAFRMFEEGVGSVRKEIDILRSVWENLLITIGNSTKGPINGIIKGLQNTVNAFKSWGGAATNIFAAIALGFTTKIGSLVGGFKTIRNLFRETTLAHKLETAENIKSAAAQVAADKTMTEAVRQGATQRIRIYKTEIAAIKAEQAAVANLKSSFKALAISAGWMVAVIAVQQLVAYLISLDAKTRELNKKWKEVNRTFDDTNGKIKILSTMIGNGSDERSLTHAIKIATELFPEFAGAIETARKEAAKTKEWEKLIGLLNELNALQLKIEKNKIFQERVSLYTDKLADKLWKSSKGGPQASVPYADYMEKLRDRLEKANWTKEDIKKIFKQASYVMVSNYDDFTKQVVELRKLFKEFGIDTYDLDFKKLVADIRKGEAESFPTNGTRTNPYAQAADAARSYNQTSKEIAEEEGQARWDEFFKKFQNERDRLIKDFGKNTKDFKEGMAVAVENLVKGLEGYYVSDANKQVLEGLQKQYPSQNKPTSASIGDAGSGSSKKNEWEKFTETLDEYPKKLKELENQWHNNAITQAEYDKEITKLNLDTWKAIAAISDLDSKMKSLSKERVDTINTVKAKVPHDADVANSYRDIIDALHNFNDKKIEIVNKNNAGGYANPDDFMEELTKLENETYNTISSFKQLDTAVGLLSDPLRNLYNGLKDAAKANKDYAEDIKNLSIESIVITPDFEGRDAKEIKDKRSDYQELVNILSKYISERKKLDYQKDKGIITNEQYDKNLASLNVVAGMTTGSLRNLSEVAAKLPPAFQEFLKKINEFKLPESEPELEFDEQSIKDTFDNFSKKANELLLKNMSGMLSDNDYNKELEKLALETINATKDFEALGKSITNLPQAYQDVYNALMDLKRQIENTNGGKLPEAPETKNNNVPDNADYVNKQPEVKVDVKVEVDPKEVGKNVNINVNGDSSDGKSENEKMLDLLKEYNKLVDKANKGKKQVELETEFDKEKLEIDLEIKLEKVEELKTYIANLLADEKSYDAVGTLTDAAKEKLKELQEEFKKAIEESEILGEKVQLSNGLIQLKSDIDAFEKSAVDNISNVASAFDRLMDAIESISSAFGAELEWEGLKKVMSVINATIQVMESLKSIILTVQAVQEAASKKHVLNAGKEVVANTAVAASEKVKASAQAKSATAGAANSVASVPYIGAILAVAAIGAITAALLAGMNKFAGGGIVQGSTKGDKNIVRANGGELILNKAQQSRLFKAIDTGNLGGGKVEFVIRGDTLWGVLKNNDRKWGR